ncbi:MAG TPA: DUF262 domain-containing HNH endonuclease family protein [Candidatus Binatia bacterium]|nr:DUF262 domain-containing HNH endonuclease family protein [Candidatus Binatia bacterium]
MEAGKRNITDIFNRARTLEIPFFQRSYVWSERNWQRFLDDMKQTASSGRPYFLGSVIQKQRPTSTGSKIGDARRVIDGQQRLTTLVLFFNTLCRVHNRLDLFDTTFRDFEGRLILQHNHADIEPFEAALESRLTSDVKAQYRGSRIIAAHDYFENKRNVLEGISPLSLLQLVYFVGIDLGSDEDEQQIFDTLNSLGVALSTAELLKNELFKRDDVHFYRETWRKVFEHDAPTRKYWDEKVTAGRTRRGMVDVFLQSFLMMQDDVGEELRVDRLFEEYKQHLACSGTDRNAFITELTRTAVLFRENVRANVLEEELDRNIGVDRLNVLLFGLNTTTVLPYALYVLKTVPDRAEREKMFRLIENYLIRRLVCRETTKNYNNLFSSFMRARLNSCDSLAGRLAKTTDPTVRIPTDEEFVRGFVENNLSNGQAKILLYMLERSIRNDERQSTALMGASRYSLEHLMPKKWRNHWGTLPAEEAHRRDQALRKLGNLSLLSTKLNTSIRDGAWEIKKNGSKGRHGLQHYASSLETLAPYLSRSVWDDSAIYERGRWLAEQALRVWPFPSL